MELNYKLESLRFLTQVHRSQFDERRRHELKIFFSSLTLYIFSVAAIYGGKIDLPGNSWFKLIIWIMFLAVAGATSVFLAYIHMANNKNKTFAERAEHAIDALLQDKDPTTLPVLYLKDTEYWIYWHTLFKSPKSTGRWSWFWQTVTVLVFSVTSAWLITLK